MQRVLRGERRRISVDFAHAIEEATGGQVAWSLWRSATAAAASSHTPEPSRKAKRRGGGSGSSGGTPGTSAREGSQAGANKGASFTTSRPGLVPVQREVPVGLEAGEPRRATRPRAARRGSGPLSRSPAGAAEAP